MTEVKSFFDILNTTLKKTPRPSPEQIQKHTNQWMLLMMMSCDQSLAVLAHELGKIKVSNTEFFDVMYYGIPKCNKFIKYNAKKVKTEEELLYIMEYFGVSREVAKDYQKLISEDELKKITEFFTMRGVKK